MKEKNGKRQKIRAWLLEKTYGINSVVLHSEKILECLEEQYLQEEKLANMPWLLENEDSLYI